MHTHGCTHAHTCTQSMHANLTCINRFSSKFYFQAFNEPSQHAKIAVWTSKQVSQTMFLLSWKSHRQRTQAPMAYFHLICERLFWCRQDSFASLACSWSLLPCCAQPPFLPFVGVAYARIQWPASKLLVKMVAGKLNPSGASGGRNNVLNSYRCPKAQAVWSSLYSPLQTCFCLLFESLTYLQFAFLFFKFVKESYFFLPEDLSSFFFQPLALNVK